MIILFTLLHFLSIYFLAPRYLQISCLTTWVLKIYLKKRSFWNGIRIESKNAHLEDLSGFKNGVGRAVFVLLVTGNIQYLPKRRPAKELLGFRIIFNDPFLML